MELLLHGILLCLELLLLLLLLLLLQCCLLLLELLLLLLLLLLQCHLLELQLSLWSCCRHHSHAMRGHSRGSRGWLPGEG